MEHLQNVKSIFLQQDWMATVSRRLVEGVLYFENNFVNKATAPIESWVRSNVGSLAFWQRYDALLAENISSYSQGMPYNNPFNVVFLIACYFIMILLSRVVMDACFKDGFRPRLIQIVHNAICVALSLFMTLEGVRQAMLADYDFFSNAVGKGTQEQAFAMRDICYVFFCSKVYEFVDTLIMILRKNYRQVSFLHVYHHSSIFVIQWFVTYTMPGGEAYLSVVLNSAVHTVMYGYYLTVTLGVPLLFIKPYITIMQMTQFICLFTQSVYDLFYPPDNVPNFLKYALATYMVTMLILFSNFFIGDRIRSARLKKKPKQD